MRCKGIVPNLKKAIGPPKVILHASTSGDTMTVFWLNPNSDTCCLRILRQNLQKQQDPQVIPGIGLKQESQQRLVCNLRIRPCQGAGHRRVHDEQNLSASAGVGSTVASYALIEQFAFIVGPLVDATYHRKSKRLWTL